MFVGCQAGHRFEASSVVLGIHDASEVNSELLVAVIVVALDRCILDRVVHPLDLTIGPGMIHHDQPVLDVILGTDVIEDVREGIVHLMN